MGAGVSSGSTLQVPAEMSSEADVLEFAKASTYLTVGELVRQLQESQRIRVDKAARIVYQMREGGEIILEDQDPPRSVLGYALSLYSLWFWFLLVVVALTTLSIYILPQDPPCIYLRYAAGALLVLYLPGASIIEALYPKKEDLESWERLALSIGLSLAVIPLVSLVLNYTPWGIRLNPMFISLSLLITGLAVLAIYRKVGYFMTKVDMAPILKVSAEKSGS